jgi:hypothetical protein
VNDASVDSRGTEHIVVHNPWGSNGKEESTNDGFTDMTFEQFLKAYGEVAIKQKS